MSESLSSRSSVPSLLRDISQDETDEIVIFDEEFEIEEEYQYGVGLDDDIGAKYHIKLKSCVSFRANKFRSNDLHATIFSPEAIGSDW